MPDEVHTTTRTQSTHCADMSSTTNINQHNTTSSTGYHIGLYGWRKKCLFVLIVGLMILIIVNLALTLWILKVMEFSSVSLEIIKSWIELIWKSFLTFLAQQEGMGQLKVVAGGLQLSGQTLILDVLRASTIRSRHGQPISLGI